jgi:hypothetical protein
MVTEYNINMDNKLTVGDTLSDASGNKFIVIDQQYKNTHSQYASELLIECYGGPRNGQVKWVPHQFAIQYKDKK